MLPASKVFRYDMIIGRDLMTSLGIKIDFESHIVEWGQSYIDMKDMDIIQAEDMYSMMTNTEPDILQKATDRVNGILDAKYVKADLQQVTEDCSHLDEEEQVKMKTLLERCEHLFDGTLGTWRDKPHEVELKPYAQPYHARWYPVPQCHDKTLRMEVDRLVEIGVPKKVNHSE